MPDPALIDRSSRRSTDLIPLQPVALRLDER
jgi:hypothetical protein